MTKPNIDDFISRKKKEAKKPGIEISGSFSCDECDDVVNKAMYIEESKEISWECCQGHISYGRM